MYSIMKGFWTTIVLCVSVEGRNSESSYSCSEYSSHRGSISFLLCRDNLSLEEEIRALVLEAKYHLSREGLLRGKYEGMLLAPGTPYDSEGGWNVGDGAP